MKQVSPWRLCRGDRLNHSAQTLPDPTELTRTTPNPPEHKLLKAQQGLVIISVLGDFDPPYLHHLTSDDP